MSNYTLLMEASKRNRDTLVGRNFLAVASTITKLIESNEIDQIIVVEESLGRILERVNELFISLESSSLVDEILTERQRNNIDLTVRMLLINICLMDSIITKLSSSMDIGEANGSFLGVIDDAFNKLDNLN